MTKIRQTREITIETHSITIIRAKVRPLSAHCERCQTTVPVFAAAQPAGFLGLSAVEIYRRVEKKQIHLTDNRRGVASICGNSLDDSENK